MHKGTPLQITNNISLILCVSLTILVPVSLSVVTTSDGSLLKEFELQDKMYLVYMSHSNTCTPTPPPLSLSLGLYSSPPSDALISNRFPIKLRVCDIQSNKSPMQCLISLYNTSTPAPFLSPSLSHSSPFSLCRSNFRWIACKSSLWHSYKVINIWCVSCLCTCTSLPGLYPSISVTLILDGWIQGNKSLVSLLYTLSIPFKFSSVL